MGKGRGVYRVLIERPEGKKPLGRPRRRWKDNTEVDLREIGIDGANWIQLAQYRAQWWACVNTAWTFGFHKKGFFWQAEWQSAFQIISCTMA
jgi:hypothetical protein